MANKVGSIVVANRSHDGYVRGSAVTLTAVSVCSLQPASTTVLLWRRCRGRGRKLSLSRPLPSQLEERVHDNMTGGEESSPARTEGSSL